MSKLVMPFIHLIPCGCSMPCLDEAALSFEDKKSAHSGFLSPPMPNVLGSSDSASLLPPPESWRHNVIRCRTPRKQEVEGRTVPLGKENRGFRGWEISFYPIGQELQIRR